MHSPAPLARIVSLVLIIGLPAAAQSLWVGKPLRDYVESLRTEGFTIIYSSDLVRDEFTIRAEPDQSAPIDSLRNMLAAYGLTLDSGPAGSLLIRRGEAYARVTLRVTVRDAMFGQALAGAEVLIDGASAGTTDIAGTLGADVEMGTRLVSVRLGGYGVPAERALEAVPGDPVAVEFRLARLPEPLPEIIVTSSRYQLRYATPAAHTFLDRELTTKLPHLADEAVRAVVRLPGTTSGGVSTRHHVRGGAENEQLFLLDGLRLYEPYHLKDFHSIATIVEQGVIAGIDFYSAGYPARYGDRMSGVVDISLREPPTGTYTELGLSLFNTSALSMGRFGAGNRGDWMVSARRGNLDLIADAVNPDLGSPLYQDSLAHIGWQLGDRTYLSANLLYSYDKISLATSDKREEAGANYRNAIAWLKAGTDWTDRLSSETTLSVTEIHNNRRGIVLVPDVSNGRVDDRRDFTALSLNQHWQFDASGTWLLRAGFDLKRLEAEYAYSSQLEILPPFDTILDNQPLTTRDIAAEPEGEQYALYAEARWRPVDRLVFDAGLRWDQQTYTTSDDDTQVSPRLNLLYRIGQKTELRLGFGQFYQAQEINELQVGDGLDQYFPAQRARHLVASLSHSLDAGPDVRLEWYQKKYHSLMPRFENVFDPLVLIPELQIDRVRIDARTAIARGAELMFSGERRDLLWWVSYSWSQIQDNLPEGTVPRSWHQEHALKAGLNWDWKAWSFSAAGVLHSGWPKTLLLPESIANPDGTTELSLSTTQRNSLQHAQFHTLDIRVSRRITVPKGELTAFLEITNLYNRQNPCCTEYSLGQDPEGNPVLESDDGYWLPLVPSLGVVWSF
ncbi:MAG: TonB-dependent receptor [Gammaproteobacteria bacterium]|nr:TonB-dependent receptor [Gammaproteobacteria bacterium]